MESKKNDIIEDKLRWDLLPLSLIKEVVKVFHFGAKKYSPNSWQNLENGYDRYKAALFRTSKHTKAEKPRTRKAACIIWHTWNGTHLPCYIIHRKTKNKNHVSNCKQQPRSTRHDQPEASQSIGNRRKQEPFRSHQYLTNQGNRQVRHHPSHPRRNLPTAVQPCHTTPQA